jgi:anti-anti-sigma regulatory factor
MPTATIVLDSRPDPVLLQVQLRRALADAGAQDSDVRVDASAVERFPTPCLQLLLSAEATLKTMSRALILRNPSFALGLACEALGFEGDREIFAVEFS